MRKTLNHFQAAVLLANKTRDIDTNWDNVLKENRRSGNAFNVKTGEYEIRGNHHLFGYIPFEIVAGKSQYRYSDIERLAKAIVMHRGGTPFSIPQLIAKAA